MQRRPVRAPRQCRHHVSAGVKNQGSPASCRTSVRLPAPPGCRCAAAAASQMRQKPASANGAGRQLVLLHHVQANVVDKPWCKRPETTCAAARRAAAPGTERAAPRRGAGAPALHSAPPSGVTHQQTWLRNLQASHRRTRDSTTPLRRGPSQPSKAADTCTRGRRTPRREARLRGCGKAPHPMADEPWTRRGGGPAMTATAGPKTTTCTTPARCRSHAASRSCAGQAEPQAALEVRQGTQA